MPERATPTVPSPGSITCDECEDQSIVAPPLLLKPITPWVGSKRGRSLREILDTVPPHDRLIDPFAGGGSVVLGVRSPVARIGDACEDIANVFSVLKSSGQGALVGALDALTERRTKDDYLAIRDGPVPADPIARAARFLYLIKLAHGNLHRVNRSGRFNVAYGNRPTRLCDPENLAAVAAYLASPDVTIVVGDYRATVADAGPGDLCYLDPPYMGKTFSGYLSEPFDHEAYRDTVIDLDRRGVKVIASNSNHPMVHQLFAAAIASGRFKIREVSTARGFHSSDATDTLMWNF